MYLLSLEVYDKQFESAILCEHFEVLYLYGIIHLIIGLIFNCYDPILSLRLNIYPHPSDR